jgi:hypothetical protein
MRKLESLNLSGLGQLDDEGLAALAAATSLQELVANRCPQLRCRGAPTHRFTLLGMSRPHTCARFQRAYSPTWQPGYPGRSDNVTSGFDICNRGGALSPLARLPRLRALSLQDCALLSDHALACLAGAPALEQLLLDMCERITDAGAAAFSCPVCLSGSFPAHAPHCRLIITSLAYGLQAFLIQCMKHSE